MRSARGILVSWLVLAALVGCGSPTTRSAPTATVALHLLAEPEVVVARFLDAANRRDHAAMAARFGTPAGPIAEGGGVVGCAFRRVGSWIGLGARCLAKQDLELRMDLMAAILAHQSYRVGIATMVAGRKRPAVQIDVALVTVAQRRVAVPFVLLQDDRGRWLVQEVGLERLVG